MFSIRLPKIGLKSAISVALALGVAAMAAIAATPTLDMSRALPEFEKIVPGRIGGWREVKSPYVQIAVATDDRGQAVAATYDETLMRTYVDDAGHAVMLALAYGLNQRQEAKIHRPELCYVAQGFKVLGIESSLAHVPGVPDEKVVIKRMLVEGRDRKEAVSYWIRVGKLFSESAFDTRVYILGQGLKGEVPDGILVRASQIVPRSIEGEELERIYAVQEKFLSDLVEAVPETSRASLTGW